MQKNYIDEYCSYMYTVLMRHGIVHKKLGRHHNHRKALFLNLKKAIIEHGSIETTITKAKVLRPLIEKLVTKAKNKTDLAAYKSILSELHQDEKIAKILVEKVVKEYAQRPGGYTRIIRSRIRQDNTQMAIIEFVDFRKAA